MGLQGIIQDMLGPTSSSLCGFQVFVRLGRQKWRLKGKIESDDSQTWDEEEKIFIPNLHEKFEIKVWCIMVGLEALGSQGFAASLLGYQGLLKILEQFSVPGGDRGSQSRARVGFAVSRSPLAVPLPVQVFWDCLVREHWVFVSLQVTELRGLATILVGVVTCDSISFFSTKPQAILVDITELGTIKLRLEVLWK